MKVCRLRRPARRNSTKAASREAKADDSDRIAAQVNAAVATGRIARTLKAVAGIDRETLLNCHLAAILGYQSQWGGSGDQPLQDSQ